MATRVLEVVVTGDKRRLSRTFDGVGDDGERMAGRIKRSSHVAATALKGIAVGGAVIAATGLKKATDAAIEAEKSQAKLVTQLKASGISYRAHAKEIDNVIQRVSKLSGLDDEDLADSFTNIVRVTGDVNKSLRLTGLAADFARAKHMDVAKAGELVGKVAGGNTGILGRYGIVIDKNASASEALAALQQKFSGQAAAYGKTTAGAMDRASVASENLGEIVGTKLTPWLAKGATALVNLVDRAGKLGGPIRQATGAVNDAYQSVVRGVRRFAERNKEELQTAAQAMRNLGKAAKFVFEEIILPTIRVAIRRIGPILDAFKDTVSGLVRFITNVLTGRWSKAWEAFKDIVKGNFRLIFNILRGAVETLGTLAVKIGGVIVKGIAKGLGSVGHAIFDRVKEGISWAAKQTASWLDKANPFKVAGNVAKSIGGDGIGRAIGGGALPQGGAFGGNLMGARPAMRPFAAVGSRFGLQVSSGRRPGAITSSGNTSWHSTGEAIDMAGPAPGMMGFFKAMRNRFGGRLAELIYTPGGVGIKNGQPYRYGGQVAADHFDHVHVAFDSGRPGIGDGLGRFDATSYGPPWGGIQGTGVTATGVNLKSGPRRYGVAVDPNVIPLGSRLKISPNPFGYGGFFEAFDTGGAIKGNRIDFYDWRGRAAQNKWGHRSVTVSMEGAAGKRSGGGRGLTPSQRSARGAFRTFQRGQSRAAGAAEHAASLTGPGFAGTYEQQIANVGVETAAARARDNLPALIKALQHELRIKRRRLKLVKRRLKRRIPRDSRVRLTEERSTLIADVAELVATLKEYRADAAGGATTITQAEGMEAGVAADAGSDGAAAGPTQTDFLNAALAEASLTPGLGDDITATEALLAGATNELNLARASGDPNRLISAIEVWKSLNDSLTQLREAVTLQTETQNRIADAQKELAAELKTYTDFATSVAGISQRTAIKALSDVISGQMIGTNLSGRRLTAGNGTIALTP